MDTGSYALIILPKLCQNRSVRVIDNAVAKDSITSRLKVEDGNDLQVGAPMKGEVLDIKVNAGEVVEKGQGIEFYLL